MSEPPSHYPESEPPAAILSPAHRLHNELTLGLHNIVCALPLLEDMLDDDPALLVVSQTVAEVRAELQPILDKLVSVNVCFLQNEI